MFTKKYTADDILRYEFYPKKQEAINSENQLKNWHKEWKWNLNKQTNPESKTISLEEIDLNCI